MKTTCNQFSDFHFCFPLLLPMVFSSNCHCVPNLSPPLFPMCSQTLSQEDNPWSHILGPNFYSCNLYTQPKRRRSQLIYFGTVQSLLDSQNWEPWLWILRTIVILKGRFSNTRLIITQVHPHYTLDRFFYKIKIENFHFLGFFFIIFFFRVLGLIT
jgi:hypothetical protein